MIKNNWDNTTRDNDLMHGIFKKPVILCCFSISMRNNLHRNSKDAPQTFKRQTKTKQIQTFVSQCCLPEFFCVCFYNENASPRPDCIFAYCNNSLLKKCKNCM